MSDYIVFARKYRPSILKDVVGQEVLSQALHKALTSNQLSPAILLHGIRGVGKTTTARIIAKGLNCEKGPTSEPCGACSSCEAIQNDRHLDVIEMDAASHTGVDDIREIIETARYKAVQGRFKVYIIDEVHMLSKSAFNALLKTLEEPPPAVKFIFATTEIQKVPETILSRCMRFDLKRLDIPTIIKRLRFVCEKENIKLEDEAAALLARAAEGSMRDGLSLLDQAFALSKDSKITTESVRTMLGMSGREDLFALVEALFKGETETLLTTTDAMFQEGTDPLLLAKDLLDGLYWLIAFQAKPSLKDEKSLPESEREITFHLAQKLPKAGLLHIWQVLSKQYELIFKAPNPFQALQMVLLQLAHLAAMPSIQNLLQGKEEQIPTSPPSPSVLKKEDVPLASQPISSPKELLKRLQERKELMLYAHVLNDIEIQLYGPGIFKFYRQPTFASSLSFTKSLQGFLEKETGQSWILEDLGEKASVQSLADLKKAHDHQKQQEALNHPTVQKILETFPGSKVQVEINAP